MYTLSFLYGEGGVHKHRAGLCWWIPSSAGWDEAEAYLSHQNCVELTHDLIGAEELDVFKKGVSPGYSILGSKPTLQETEEEVWEFLFL